MTDERMISVLAITMASGQPAKESSEIKMDTVNPISPGRPTPAM
jgi:hypothetical protein